MSHGKKEKLLQNSALVLRTITLTSGKIVTPHKESHGMIEQFEPQHARYTTVI